MDRGVRLRRDTIPDFPKCDLYAVLLDMEKDDTNQINAIYAEMEKELKALDKVANANKMNHHVIDALRYACEGIRRSAVTKSATFTPLPNVKRW